MRPDVLIVGAGPVGLATAIATASMGMSVEVIDAGRPPLPKACGEGLMPESLTALLSLGVDVKSIPGLSFRGIRFVGPLTSSEAHFSSGVGKGIRRTALSQLLLDRAADVGVRFRWQTAVRGLQGRSVHLDTLSIAANWVIGADGLHSSVRRMAGLDRTTVYSKRIGLRQHFRIAPWTDLVEVYWEKESQAYVTPVAANTVCVAIVSRKRPNNFSDAISSFPHLLERLGAAHPEGKVRGSPTWGLKVSRVVRNNVALVGDASGAVDAITGEGLAVGFHQAHALSQALVADDLPSYERSHKEIGRLPHFMSRNMLLLADSHLIRSHVLHALGRDPALFRSLLQVHTGASMPSWLGREGVLHLGLKLLLA